MCNSSSGGGGAVRKGPWTEQEDAQLAWFVRLLGEHRWDFLAQVSGLRRTGKSCRLRWVNYLQPGLKRCRITADEERLILQLHEQWGSRWSRIARRLPGRTDNEIKNYWRTHTRKTKAQEEKTMMMVKKKKMTTTTAASPSSSSSSSLTTTSSLNDGATYTATSSASASASAATTAEADEEATTAASQHQEERCCFAMEVDQLWSEIAAAESYAADMISWPVSVSSNVVAAAMPSSPAWELYADYSLWSIDDEEYYNKIL